MKRLPSLCLFIALIIFGCNSRERPPSGIVGRWAMHKIYMDDSDVTSEHNPAADRYILFKEDGTFESGGQPAGNNTGKYQFSSEENKLFIDSDAGEEDDSYWQVEIKGDTMTWQGFGTAWAESFQLVHVRQ